eukprot:5307230-Amphidinium_carterae.1
MKDGNLRAGKFLQAIASAIAYHMVTKGGYSANKNEVIRTIWNYGYCVLVDKLSFFDSHNYRWDCSFRVAHFSDLENPRLFIIIQIWPYTNITIL